MTGFGRAEQAAGTITFLVDIKSLNGKQFELMLRTPAVLKPYEFEIRKILAEQLNRGTVDCLISVKESGESKPVTINTSLAKAYYKPLSELAISLKLDASQILGTLVKLPEVITPAAETLNEQDWQSFRNILNSAIDDLKMHRNEEGRILEKDLLSRIDHILQLREEIAKMEPARKQKIRDGLMRLIKENTGSEDYDRNRLEQEMIFYIEKMDISEEQVRLKSHCDYFKTILQENGDTKGKKLSFILQEIGREINTTGSKAYDAGIQQYVVIMKDELEKAKEQILNVL